MSKYVNAIVLEGQSINAFTCIKSAHKLTPDGNILRFEANLKRLSDCTRSTVRFGAHWPIKGTSRVRSIDQGTKLSYTWLARLS
jgi:hypothetical protein